MLPIAGRNPGFRQGFARSGEGTDAAAVNAANGRSGLPLRPAGGSWARSGGGRVGPLCWLFPLATGLSALVGGFDPQEG